MAINTIIIMQVMINNIVDIHSHIIFGVDDGAETIEDSIKTLELLEKLNIKKVICTPHLCQGNIDYIKKIKENYLKIMDIAKQKNIDLYLGSEILITPETSNLLLKKRLRSLNGNKYVLVEFKRNENMEEDKAISLLEEIIDVGYKPILAHPELYINYRNIKFIKKLKEIGILLQLDASSILRKKTSRKIYKYSKKLLKLHLIDIIASDNHSNIKRNYLVMKEAYKVINKKYGREYAEILFSTNPYEVLN